LNIERKLLFYIFLIPLIGIIIGISGGMYLINYSNTLSQQQGQKYLQQRELELQKERLKIVVNSVINNIIVLRHLDIDFINIIKDLYPPRKDKYIFIYKVYNLNGGKNFAKMLININRPDLEGKMLSDDYKDIKGVAFRKKMLESIRKNGEGFVTYYYKKPKSNKIIPKISYFKYYKPLNLIIASGVYLDDIDNIIKDYQTHLDGINQEILKTFIFISFLIFIITMLFTIVISKTLTKEFEKFRKKISLNEKKLRYKLYIDELTKLKSRKSLVEDIPKNNFDYLILIDIDNFGSINQFFGAEIGDIYLQEFAKLLKLFRKKIYESIKIYRLGADEFAISVKKSDAILVFIEKLHTFLNNQKIVINNEELDVDTTIVFSKSPNPLKKALLALTEAKNSNCSVLSYYEVKNKNKQKEFFEIKKMLKIAIEQNQITPFAQAIVDNNQNIIKYELLMRIVTDKKVIPPYFLEYAKQIKLYTKISSIMINKCFEFIKTTNILCSINIDMQDIENEEIIKRLKENVISINKPVVFEILESESFKNYDKLNKFVKEFKEYGVLFAIDDFGSGYSNYKEILELKPNYLKIDGSLIKNIISSKENLILIDSILFLTKMLGIKTTAEFVENEEIFKKLRALGIDEFQGYYFSKPKPLYEI